MAGGSPGDTNTEGLGAEGGFKDFANLRRRRKRSGGGGMDRFGEDGANLRNRRGGTEGKEGKCVGNSEEKLEKRANSRRKGV